MYPDVCPFDAKGRPWLDSLAEGGMRMALVKPEAMRDLLDRHEGKVTQPIEPTGVITLKVVYDDSNRV